MQQKQPGPRDEQAGGNSSSFSTGSKTGKDRKERAVERRVRRATAAARMQLVLHKKRKNFLQTYAAYCLGEWFYELGFAAEYNVVRLGRMAVALIKLAGRGIAWLGRRAAKATKEIGVTIWKDLTAPFSSVFRGVRGVFRETKAGYQEKGAAHAARHGARYLGHGMVKYLRVLGRLASYLLPVGAAAAFALTVNGILERDYALAVECNGEVVGYVADELVFDAAKDKVKSRIVLAQDQSWDVDPTFTLAVASGELLDNNEMADAILMASADEITEATGLEVDGQLVAITQEGDRLRDYFEQLKAPYLQPDNPNLTVEFVQSVNMVDGLYATHSITSYDSVVAMLSGEKEEQQNYAIQSGDSLSGVASKFDLTSAELKALNPKLADASYNWPIGDTLIVHQSVPYLQVKTIETVETDEVVAHDTVTNEDSSLAWNTKKTTQQGEDGMDHVVYQYVSINGVLTETITVSRVRTKEPVTEIVSKGTKLPNNMVSTTAELGSGTWVWPVPGYKYVSRWMSYYHKGADICAAYGTPIIAADSGVVVTAGYNAAGRGYGNSIIIDHGDGRRTLYAHCSSLAVGYGQSVRQGQIIGYVGSTGDSSGNHCHFEIFINGVRRSARDYFPGM